MEDLAIFYRMTDIPSTNPSPWGQDDKMKLNTVCLKSFLEGFSDINISIHFILDHCGPEYDEMIQGLVENCTLEHTELGINATMLRSYELAVKKKGYVLFQECDYLYQPKIGRVFVDALKELSLVSPYDHRNFYIDRNLHSTSCELALVDDYHFRSTERNTMTWGTHSGIVRDYLDMLIKYGYLDDQVWTDFLYLGYRLWVPIPSFATHCVTNFLAPSTDWSRIWTMYR